MKLTWILVLLMAITMTGDAQAEALQVTVECGKKLGKGGQISDFLGAGGELYPFANDPGHAVVKAWKRVGFKRITFETLHLEEDFYRWLKVTREKNGKLNIDFTDYDRYMRFYRDTLGAEPYVYLGNIPRVLSRLPKEKEHYSKYPPKDYNDWRDFCYQIVKHNVDVLGMKGLAYGVMGEPDHTIQWLPEFPRNKPTILAEYLKIWDATYRGVKEADPTAKIGGPATMNWQLTNNTTNEETLLTLEDFIKALAAHNQHAKPGKEIGLDYLAWQDYAWSSERIADSAEGAAGFLSKYGMNPKLPKALTGSGWGSWSTDYLNENLQSHQRASQIMSHMVHEFKDPARRQFWFALYYHFLYWDSAWTKDPATADPTQDRIALVFLRDDGSLYYSQTYAAFEMANILASSGGDIVSTTVGEPLEVIAVCDERQTKVWAILNNHTERDQRVEVTFHNLPMNKKPIKLGVQIIDEHHSHEGMGLMRPEWRAVEPNGQGLIQTFTLAPYSSMLVTIVP